MDDRGGVGLVRKSGGNVQDVPPPHDRVDQRRSHLFGRQCVPPLPPIEGIRPPVPFRGSVHPPPLGALGLHDQHVLPIGVGGDAPDGPGRGDVHVHVDGQAERSSGEAAQRREGRPERSGVVEIDRPPSRGRRTEGRRYVVPGCDPGGIVLDRTKVPRVGGFVATAAVAAAVRVVRPDAGVRAEGVGRAVAGHVRSIHLPQVALDREGAVGPR
mmetsp:Transcript_29101/g.86155  ORF Transcript_29101/g.86155 Transcript_29101/m.86155 type:complete len:213 (+) Transcript_29101:918-1556(+)